MPARTDISNLRRQVVALSAEVQQLVTNLEQAQAEQSPAEDREEAQQTPAQRKQSTSA